MPFARMVMLSSLKEIVGLSSRAIISSPASDMIFR